MLHLHELAQQGQQQTKIVLRDRLPVFLADPCVLEVSYHVELKEDIYLLHLNVQGSLKILCQRCVHEFDLVYNNQTIIAVARNDARAEQLLAEYECIVSSNAKVDLEEVLIDELHLYVPQFHQQIDECDKEINDILCN